MKHRWAAMLVASLFVGACESDGHNTEDERRLAVIAADPMATAVPPGAVVIGEPSEFLAETDDARFHGCCFNSVVTEFTTTDDLPTLADFYVSALTDAGWMDVTVVCLSSNTKITAVRSFDGFVGRFLVEFSTRNDPITAFQDVNAQFHTKDFDPPEGAAPDLACVTG